MGAQKKMQNVQRFASKAEKKIEKLRLENERLSTIIDTGEWSKERVSDLVGAQQVLSAERVALTKLIGRLQRQHQLAVDQHGQQEHEIRHLKDQLMSEVNIAFFYFVTTASRQSFYMCQRNRNNQYQRCLSFICITILLFRYLE